VPLPLRPVCPHFLNINPGEDRCSMPDSDRKPNHDLARRVLNQYVIDAKPGNTFPSDHFREMADLIIEE
jgi:hypothetical protein